MRHDRAWMILISMPLLLFAHPAHAAEIDLPPIETRCNLNTAPLFSPSSLSLPSVPPSIPVESWEERKQLNEIQKRIAAKEWQQAWTALQSASEWTQERSMSPLLIAMIHANQVQRATQLLIQKFPSNSYSRAKGIGIIAAELTQRDQFPAAIELLKPQKNTNTYFTVAVLPVAKTLASINRVDKISEVVALFPEPEMQRILWMNIIRATPFQPDQAKQVAAMIEEATWRSEAITRMANYWFYVDPSGFLNGWAIASDIEDCKKRAFSVLEGFESAGSRLSEAQKSQALDQLESFLNTISKTLNDRSTQNEVMNFRLTLARLSIQNRRKVQGARLLEQLTTTLKQNRELSSGWRFLQIAKQYQQLGNGSRAVQSLDSAVLASRDDEKSATPIWTSPEWRDRTLREIAQAYRSLNQPQKATAIEKTLSTRSRRTIPSLNPMLPTQIKLPPSIPAPR